MTRPRQLRLARLHYSDNNTAMIDIDRDPDRISIKLRGQQDTASFLDLAEELARAGMLASTQRILFDWSELTSWDFVPPPKQDLQAWERMANCIRRAAIVHDRCWNRPAAWLAALLRTGRCRVRSYRPIDHERALAWLTEPWETPSERGAGPDRI